MNPNTIDSIIKQLIASHTTISTMESCTSGLIASLIPHSTEKPAYRHRHRNHRHNRKPRPEQR